MMNFAAHHDLKSKTKQKILGLVVITLKPSDTGTSSTTSETLLWSPSEGSL